MAKPIGKAASSLIFLLILTACVQLPDPAEQRPVDTGAAPDPAPPSANDVTRSEPAERQTPAMPDSPAVATAPGRPAVDTREDRVGTREETNDTTADVTNDVTTAATERVDAERSETESAETGRAEKAAGEGSTAGTAATPPGSAVAVSGSRDESTGAPGQQTEDSQLGQESVQGQEKRQDSQTTDGRSPAMTRHYDGAPAMDARHEDYVNTLCQQVGSTLGSVSVDDCMAQGFHFGGGFSANQRPLVVKDFPPAEDGSEPIRVLLMGGIHGDEYSSISIIFKWLELFSPRDSEGDFHWRFAPLVNPDGLLDGEAKRQNANGVDLNRNFPSLDWNEHASDYWVEETGRNPRRYPGKSAASEPEVKWVVRQIEEFDPDVIVSVHAPYHLLDFDGPSEAPDKIGELYLHQLGVYPGSLGNYAGIDKRIPVVTLELPSAGILPTREQIRLMWLDLVTWLDNESRKALASN